MSRPTNSGHPGAGMYASARRGGLTAFEVHHACEAIGPRATPAMVAAYLGRCVADVIAIMRPEPAPVAPSQKTEAAVVVRLDPPKPVDPERARKDKLFTDLWNAGLPLRLISERTGIPKGSFGHYKERLGLKPRFAINTSFKEGVLATTPRAQCGPKAEKLAQSVAEEYGLTLEDIRGYGRKAVPVAARHEIAGRLREAGYSHGSIAAFLKRDRATVYNNIRGWEAMQAERSAAA